MQKFELVAIRPVSGKKGELVFSMTKHANTVSDAVKAARRDVEGSGLVILQSASYHLDAPQNDQMLSALIRAHDRIAA